MVTWSEGWSPAAARHAMSSPSRKNAATRARAGPTRADLAAAARRLRRRPRPSRGPRRRTRRSARPAEPARVRLARIGATAKASRGSSRSSRPRATFTCQSPGSRGAKARPPRSLCAPRPLELGRAAARGRRGRRARRAPRPLEPDRPRRAHRERRLAPLVEAAREPARRTAASRGGSSCGWASRSSRGRRWR